MKAKRNIQHKTHGRKATWIGNILRRNCLLKYVTEGKIEGIIEGTGRRERRHKLLFGDLQESETYWKLKEEALDRTRFARGYGLS